LFLGGAVLFFFFFGFFFFFVYLLLVVFFFRQHELGLFFFLSSVGRATRAHLSAMLGRRPDSRQRCTIA
jgi:hypothetical protein